MEIVMGRKSVRTFDGVMLSDEDIEKLKECFENSDNPYGIPIEYIFLEPGKNALKAPVLNGETLYVAAKMKRVPHFEEALGYSFESVILKAWSHGIGTVWIGGTMNRENFEKAINLKEDEVMPCVTPVGYPAKKRAFREIMMRKGIKADWRYDLSEIAFECDPEKATSDPGDAAPLDSTELRSEKTLKALSEESKKIYGDALEMVRWAPSAVNKQPWRIVVCGDTVHFYEKPDNGYVHEATGDLQRIDIGIAMYHFVYGMEEAGKAVSFAAEDPGLGVPGSWQYVASYTLEA